MSIKKILVAVDDSECAAKAANVAIELAKPLRAKIGFIHVFNPTVGPGTMWSVPADRTAEMCEREAQSLLARFRQRAATRSKVPAFLESGNPASKIVDAAKSWPADLIVIGSHGRGKIGRLLLGSVSQGVLSHAPCPVLVIRGKA